MKIENPIIIFEEQTRKVRSRIFQLEKDLLVSVHPQVKAFIEKELNMLKDDYVQRMFALKEGEDGN